ncbi:MAG: SMC-Scp complex subunit ScpB [Parvularcula sp.]
MTDNAQHADDDALSPREAQDRLAEAFATDEEEATQVPDPSADDGDAGEAGDNVTRLGEPAEEEAGDDNDNDNPFARDAALAVTMRKVEALLFASPQPLSLAAMARRIPDADIEGALERLEAHYQYRGVNLRSVDGAWQFVTAADIADVLVEQRQKQKKLSRAALETLAIIAYHQPCTRADIEEVRGVAVAKGSLDQLLELGWVRLRGRREVPGRPVLYGTTPNFLEHFGLADIGHLPGMADLKAAGLLEARLPPGFSVPVPRSDEDGEAETPDLADAAFTTDFHEEEAANETEGGALRADDAGDDAADHADEPGAGPFPDADDEPF